MSGLHIGLDLDNTLIDYDSAFVEVGREIGLLPPDRMLRTKEEVKAFLRGGGSDEDWMRLQGQVYGRYIDRARLCDGAAEFLTSLCGRGATISIVSHKTKYGHFDLDRVDLWRAALGWLENHEFFTPNGFALARESVHFTETREDKISKIREIDCDVFVDDLPEVLRHEQFPADVRGIWFAANKPAEDGAGLVPYRTWTEVARVVAGLL